MRSNTTHTHRVTTQGQVCYSNQANDGQSWNIKLELLRKKAQSAYSIACRWNVSLVLMGATFSTPQKKKRGHHHREKQKYNMVREIPNYIILAPRSSCI